MVDSLSFNKIRSITHNKPAVGSGKEKPGGDRKQSSKDGQNKGQEKDRVGVNIDEQC